jgi:hypothetical protein
MFSKTPSKDNNNSFFKEKRRKGISRTPGMTEPCFTPHVRSVTPLLDTASVRSEPFEIHAACAAVIGACYLASFCAAKRMLARATVAARGPLAPSGSKRTTSEYAGKDQVCTSLFEGVLFCHRG